MQFAKLSNITANKSYFRLLVLVGVFGLAFFLRIYDLENFPSQINQDELSNIYDAYSIVETGADRWGIKNPVILRAFGENDYRPPLYTWLVAGSIKVFGYSVFAGRLPSVVLGMLSLILLYKTSKKIGGRIFSNLALLIATLSPWHIIMSRLALEAASLSSFFIILTIYLWIKAKESNFNTLNLIYLSLCIGFATNAYQSTKLIFFLIAIVIFIDLIKTSSGWLRKSSIFIFFIALGALPQLYAAIAMPHFFFSRAADTIMPFSFSFKYLFDLLGNFYLNLSPQYLFSKIGNYNFLTVARLLSVEFSFFYLGLFLFYWKFKKNEKLNPIYIYLIIVISILPSALTYDNPNALRASCNLILFPMISAGGILVIYEAIGNKMLKIFLLGGISSLLFFNSMINVVKYTKSKELHGAGQQGILVELSKRINLLKDKYSKIYIEDLGNQPYIYIASYCDMNPKQFQEAYKNIERSGWDHFVQLDKYFFLNKESILETINENKDESLLILKLKDSNYNLVDSIEVHGERLFFYSSISISDQRIQK